MPTINIRSVPEEVRARFNAGASLRGWTQAEYLERLLDLHDQVRATADMGHPDDATSYCAGLLETLDLQTVHASG